MTWDFEMEPEFQRRRDRFAEILEAEGGNL
jgi:hypothetical protein